MPYEGQCLCGGCKVFVNSEPRLKGLAVCHCTDCSRSSGSPFTCGVPAPTDSVKTEGSVKLYARVNPSNGNTVNRWFCANCGAHLLSQSSGHSERIFVKAGVIEAYTKLAIILEVFTKDRWPSIPPIPGAMQIEDGQVPKSIIDQPKVESTEDRPSGTENASEAKKDL